MPISAILLQGVEQAMNQLIGMDPDIAYSLKPLSGKVIEIRIKHLDWTVYFCAHENGIQLLDTFDEDPDTVITGSAPAFLMMRFSDSPMSFFNRRDVVVEGNAETGRRFQEFFDRLEPDLEEWLSQYTGDVVAHQVGRCARSGRNWAESVVKSLGLDITEFFQHESKDLPTPYETDQWYSAVDKLRSDEDRLEARIQRLQSALSRS